ncbi:U3 small nucleolar RNA-associated protein 14 homolog A-like isoform X2 [Temnothorax americanus]|uniref:U3 small nucleolar RNA-associated protein 14 homolog A-like isoform X2 n=1 Tax=Temnothorax americanus TaxID=1964332 RepID=UPI004067B3BD
MSDAEVDYNLYDSDQEIAKHHSKLIKAVTRLDKGQRVKKAERSEPSLEVSEYHLVKSGATDKDAVSTRDLIKSLERKGDQGNIIKKLRYIQQKNKVLPKPLEKPAAERIKRTVGYDKVKEDLRKWDSIIARNRTAEQLSFPLKRLTAVKDSRASKIPAFLSGFSTKSDLMKKFEEVDPTLLYPADKEEEKGNKYKMTLEEVILRRKEAARLRAQQSYKEAKAHRQRKIKSKKFHRIQRKDKIKQQLKDFEKLKDSNPQEALAKLEQLDKTRAEERMSLRHKNTGQWARNKQIKAKYNKETRQVLAEQLAINRELTQKVKRTDSDEEDEEDEENEEYVENVEDKEDEEDEILLKNKEDLTTGGDEDSEQEEETRKIMSEAFADDDVVEEFRKEQEEEMKKSQPQDIDLSLPGWGNWGEPNVKKNKHARKKSRFILTVPKVVSRKPENHRKVIVFEHENEKLKKHLVKELPYPFTRVKDFEASIRAPISRTFVPMNAHLRLIQPTVKTKLGQVIEPMDENELVKKQSMVKKPLKRIIAKADKKKNILKSKNKKGGKQNVQSVR